jgi:SAM-dependent methyltransferase
MTCDHGRALTASSVPGSFERFLSGPLFEPWAELLRQRIPLPAGATVVDVACGPGTLTRPVARAIGARGHVLGVDVRPGMLAAAADKPQQAGAAPITYLECAATALRIPDGCADVVVCQHGLSCFSDRPGAVREMHRVLRPGGMLALSCWAAELPLGLFGPMAEALHDCGVPEPCPRAYDPTRYTLSRVVLASLLADAGFAEITVDTQIVDARWPSAEHVLATIGATGYAAAVNALPAAARARLTERLAHRWNLPDSGPMTIRTSAHLAHARKPIGAVRPSTTPEGSDQ